MTGDWRTVTQYRENAHLNPALKQVKISRPEYHGLVKKLLDGIKDEEQRRLMMRKLGESDLFFFAVYILKMTYLDNDWAFTLCNSVEHKKYGRQWIISREHYKSTIITIASTIREICMNPEGTYLIYSYNQQTAQKLFFSPIKKELDENYLLQCLYPDVLWGSSKPEDIWQSDQLNVKRKRRSKECTLACASLFSQLTGSHYEHLIYDDCSIPEGCMTADSIENTCTAWDLSLNTGVSDNLNVCVIGTYYTFHELYEYIEKKGLFETIVQPCMDENGVGILWNDSVIAEKKKAMGSYVFATQCLCNPKMADSIGFKDDWIKYWHAQTYAGLNIYIFVDPAGVPNRKRDNSVFWVIGVDAQDNYYVIDLVADKLTLTQRADVLFYLVRNYHPLSVYYEQVGMQADIEHIRDRQERTNYRFSITPLPQTEQKNLRIERLIPLFEFGHIYIPEHCWHKNWQGQDEDMIQTFITEEYKAYPHLQHDDRLDDLANIVHPQVYMQRPTESDIERVIYEKLKGRGTADIEWKESRLDDGSNFDPFSKYR